MDNLSISGSFGHVDELPMFLSAMKTKTNCDELDKRLVQMQRPSGTSPCDLQIPTRLKLAVSSLLEASVYAQQSASDCWEFAVEIDSLLKMGLSLNDLRLLVRLELVEHKREVTLESDNGRAFRPTGDLMFPPGTCFVLTPNGVSFSQQLSCDGIGYDNSAKNNSNQESQSSSSSGFSKENNSSFGSEAIDTAIPCWDSGRRILTIDGRIVKQFKWVAENQEAVLSVFQEEGWPSRIDDPLSPMQEQDSKRRLSDTIKCLNRKQCNALIHFRGDGTGEGVIWERVKCNGTDAKFHFERAD